MSLFKKTNPETSEITYFSDDKCITSTSTEDNTAKENATECKTEGGRRRKSKKSKKAKKTKKSKKSKKTKKSRKH